MVGKNWRMRWMAALTPDQSMIPGDEVFTVTAQKRSLTATIGDTPGLLLSDIDPRRENIFALRATEMQQIISTEQGDTFRATHSH